MGWLVNSSEVISYNNFDNWYPNILGIWDPKILTMMNQASGEQAEVVMNYPDECNYFVMDIERSEKDRHFNFFPSG